jgi:hypothetical protein
LKTPFAWEGAFLSWNGVVNADSSFLKHEDPASFEIFVCGAGKISLPCSVSYDECQPEFNVFGEGSDIDLQRRKV